MKANTISALLIEDNLDSVQLIQEELNEERHSKFKLQYAERLSAGLELLRDRDFDVILLDMSLPDSQGIDTLTRVHDQTPEIPIIVLTNHDDESFAIETVQKGAQDYLIKSCLDGNLLARSIRYAIERCRMLENLKQAKLQMQHLAHHDSLTDLPNRHSFYDHLDKAMARARRNNKMVAVLFLDLDKFKSINDSHGHHIGDIMLVSAANRLKTNIRESDIVARMGGDEFTIILDCINSEQDAAKVAQKTLESMLNEFVLEEHKLSITTSIGISIYPKDGHDIDTIVKKADFAMYDAKENGRNNYKFFIPELNDKTTS